MVSGPVTPTAIVSVMEVTWRYHRASCLGGGRCCGYQGGSCATVTIATFMGRMMSFSFKLKKNVPWLAPLLAMATVVAFLLTFVTVVLVRRWAVLWRMMRFLFIITMLTWSPPVFGVRSRTGSSAMTVFITAGASVLAVSSSLSLSLSVWVHH